MSARGRTFGHLSHDALLFRFRIGHLASSVATAAGDRTSAVTGATDVALRIAPRMVARHAIHFAAPFAAETIHKTFLSCGEQIHDALQPGIHLTFYHVAHFHALY